MKDKKKIVDSVIDILGLTGTELKSLIQIDRCTLLYHWRCYKERYLWRTTKKSKYWNGMLFLYSN